jgi:hypothetical protein
MVDVKDGKQVAVRGCNVESYLANCVLTYCDLAQEDAGKDVQMERADAPFLPEDQATSPQRRPLFDGSYETCPFCRRTHSKLDPLCVEARKPPSRRAGQASSLAQEVRGSTSLGPAAPAPGGDVKANKTKVVVPMGDSASEPDIAGGEMNALERIVNNGYNAASGANVARIDSDCSNTTQAKQSRQRRSNRQDNNSIDVVSVFVAHLAIKLMLVCSLIISTSFLPLLPLPVAFWFELWLLLFSLPCVPWSLVWSWKCGLPCNSRLNQCVTESLILSFPMLAKPHSQSRSSQNGYGIMQRFSPKVNLPESQDGGNLIPCEGNMKSLLPGNFSLHIGSLSGARFAMLLLEQLPRCMTLCRTYRGIHCGCQLCTSG